MKTVYILRHAKAEPEDNAPDDHGRQLNPRGQAAAERMGHYLHTQGLMPDHIISSSAARTIETAEIIHRELNIPSQSFETERRLYLAPAGELIDILQEQDDNHHSVMLVGHNPGMHIAAMDLTGDGDDGQREQLRTNFPTCALAIIQFSVDHWADIRPAQGILTHYLTPSLLNEKTTTSR